MNKRIIIRLVLIMVGAIAILGTLMAITTMPNENNNGFVRKWASEKPLEPVDTIHIEQDLSSIVGMTDNSIFIAGVSPKGVLIVNKKTHAKEILQINLKVAPDRLVPFYMKIDSPKLFLHLNNAQTIIDGKFPNSPFRTTKLETGIFLKSLQVNDSTALIKIPDSSLTNQYLYLKNLNTSQIERITELKDRKEKLVALKFDGMLLFDSINHTIIYLEYFRNKIIAFDTNLSFKYESQTIDTVSSIDLNLVKQTKNDTTDKITASTARVPVNNFGVINEGKLYIISALRADNQNLRDFNKHLNVDIYNVQNGVYVNSITVEKPDSYIPKSMYVDKNKLYIHFNKEIRIYSLASQK